MEWALIGCGVGVLFVSLKIYHDLLQSILNKLTSIEKILSNK